MQNGRKVFPMVVGVRRMFESGRVYSYSELSHRLGLVGAELDRAMDQLVEQGCLKLLVFERVPQGECVLVTCASDERLLKWQAIAA